MPGCQIEQWGRLSSSTFMLLRNTTSGSMRALAIYVAPGPPGGGRAPEAAASVARRTAPMGRLVGAAGKEENAATTLIRAGLKTLSGELGFADLKALALMENSEKEGVLLEEKSDEKLDKNKELEELDPLPPHLESLAAEVVIGTGHGKLGGLDIIARCSFLPASSHQCGGAAFQVDVVLRNSSSKFLYMIEDHEWASYAPSSKYGVSWENSSRRTVHSEKVWHPLNTGKFLKESFNVASFGAAPRRYQQWLLRGTYTVQASLSSPLLEVQEIGTEHWEKPTSVSVSITLDTPKWFRALE